MQLEYPDYYHLYPASFERSWSRRCHKSYAWTTWYRHPDTTTASNMQQITNTKTLQLEEVLAAENKPIIGLVRIKDAFNIIIYKTQASLIIRFRLPKHSLIGVLVLISLLTLLTAQYKNSPYPSLHLRKDRACKNCKERHLHLNYKWVLLKSRERRKQDDLRKNKVHHGLPMT